MKTTSCKTQCSTSYSGSESCNKILTFKFLLTTMLTFLLLFYGLSNLQFASSLIERNVEALEDYDMDSNEVYQSYSGKHHNSNHVRFPKTKRRLPQAIIIGVRKCGTRALLEMLNLHPHIVKSSGEVHFFDRDESYKNGLEWYRKRMPYSFTDQVTMEKSPAYFITPLVPERIYSMNNSIKLLLIVREPVERLISDYTQIAFSRQTKGKEVDPFEKVVLTPKGEINTSYRAIRISFYANYLKKWLQIFPRNQIHIVNGDALIKDPFPEIEKIENFLCLGHRLSRSNFYFNRTKGFYCLQNGSLQKCLSESKGRRHPDVDPALISKLRKFYKDYNQQFYKLAGQDFGWPEE